MTPAVSIVTTVFNRVDCLARCLQSVAALTFRDIEHIVVADSPPEEVLVQLRDLAEASGATFGTTPRRANDWGITPARLGLRAAKGRYVCFLSDDNAYLPDHFEPLVQALDADDGLGFVYSSCLYDGRLLLNANPPTFSKIDLGQPLFRRSALDARLPWRELCWDWKLISSLLARRVRYRHLDRATFVFRVTCYPQFVACFTAPAPMEACQ